VHGPVADMILQRTGRQDCLGLPLCFEGKGPARLVVCDLEAHLYPSSLWYISAVSDHHYTVQPAWPLSVRASAAPRCQVGR
jgi:hypothetical protein